MSTLLTPVPECVVVVLVVNIPNLWCVVARGRKTCGLLGMFNYDRTRWGLSTKLTAEPYCTRDPCPLISEGSITIIRRFSIARLNPTVGVGSQRPDFGPLNVNIVQGSTATATTRPPVCNYRRPVPAGPSPTSLRPEDQSTLPTPVVTTSNLPPSRP